MSGILVPGGFKERVRRQDFERALRARTRRVPFFGICPACRWRIEWAREHERIKDASSTEFANGTVLVVG
ncbi:hypothetical protein OVY29_05325 [Sphingopyxis sp. SE2]|uniref:hypothetical protein n=1 Tax=Sphingopyxis sp. SE2 TaxID=1586240 RepID=UPI0028C18F41|nr:hypothetical protein [Sphingopyxis sp. SE2]MDT7528078.1 hypothetical protein [Sphingopyxis sp. SE2]